MKCLVFDSSGLILIRTEERKPVCEEDFCEDCGDCLHCNGGDECVANDYGDHRWIVYEG